MRPPLIISVIALIAWGISAATPAATPASGPFEGPAPAPTIPLAEDNPVLKGALLKTEWPNNVRNPFKYEAAETFQEIKPANERIRVIGLGSFVAEHGGLRSYAFLEKETQGPPPTKDEKPAEDKPAEAETLMLQSFPEILQDQTAAAEEDSDQSSVSVGIERYWFVGIDEKNAVFWVENTPVSDENLRRLALEETVKVAIRKTARGTKVKNASTDMETNVKNIRRPKAKETETAPKTPTPGPATATPAAKPATPPFPVRKPIPDPLGPIIYGNPAQNIDMLIKKAP